MNNWKVILATMVIFGAGVVTGGLLVRRSEALRFQAFNRGQMSVRPSPSPSATPTGVRTDFLRRVARELHLSADQERRIDQVLRESQERGRQLMEPVAPKLREELQRTREEFRSILTPPQARRFDELLRQQQQARPRDGREGRDPRDLRESRFPRDMQGPPAKPHSPHSQPTPAHPAELP